MPEGGLSPGLPAGSAVPVPEGGLPALSPADLAFSFLFCPHPPHPLPGGKGEIFLFSYARGFAPCIPGTEPEAALGQGGEPRARRGGRAFLVAG